MNIGQERFSTFVQHNIVVLLCFGKKKQAEVLRGLVAADLFEGVYREIAASAIDFIDKYHRTPKKHISDLLEPILTGKDSRKARVYKKILNQIHASRKSIDADYVISEVHEFVAQQELKRSVYEAARILQSGASDASEQAVEVLSKGASLKPTVFDPGVFLADTKRSLRFLKKEWKEKTLRTGIPELDNRFLGPSPGTIQYFIGLPGRGKTWWCIHLGKEAIIQRAKVCHVSLEISEERMLQRYFQSFFNLSKREGATPEAVLKFEDDRLIAIKKKRNVRARGSLDQRGMRKKLIKKIGKWGTKMENLVVKQFPMGQLTIPMLRSYLDLLESTCNFVPDLFILDYIDLMKLNPHYLRVELGEIGKDLRGIAVERNFAVVTPTQSSRRGVEKTFITEIDVAEDFSKIATADTVITYSQTKEEERLGLARLHVSKSRDEGANISVLITQNYNRGQFIIQSAEMRSIYWDTFYSSSLERLARKW